MARTIGEWIGKNDDQAIPARIKVQIFKRYNGRCAACTRPIGGSLRPEFDHIEELFKFEDGGGNRETNIQLLCSGCHKPKTRAAMAEKARVARKRKKHLGLANKSKRGFRRWRKFDGTIVEKGE